MEVRQGIQHRLLFDRFGHEAGGIDDRATVGVGGSVDQIILGARPVFVAPQRLLDRMRDRDDGTQIEIADRRARGLHQFAADHASVRRSGDGAGEVADIGRAVDRSFRKIQELIAEEVVEVIPEGEHVGM